jgi:single-strand DNA-binding protein
MAKGLNRHEIIGSLGKDPELKHVGKDDTPLAHFSVATNFSVKRGDDWVEETDWHNVEVWGRLAEIAAEYLQKGSRVYVAGRSVTEKWQDRDGNDRYTTKIKASEVVFLSGGDSGAGGGSAKKSGTTSRSRPPKQEPERDDSFTFDADDELPF